MSYLLDTVVLSELRKRNRIASVVEWFQNVRDADLYLSVVTIGEIEKGIRRQEQINPQFAKELAHWLDGVLQYYESRIVPVDINIARRWGELSATIGHTGADLLIAATALERGLVVVTRNIRHFEPTGAQVLNPF